MNIQKIVTVIAITASLGIMGLSTAQADSRQSGYNNYGEQRHQIKDNRRANKALRHEIRENRRQNKAIRHQVRDNRVAKQQRHQARDYRVAKQQRHQARKNVQLSYGYNRHQNSYYRNTSASHRTYRKPHGSKFRIQLSFLNGHNY